MNFKKLEDLHHDNAIIFNVIASFPASTLRQAQDDAL